MTAGATYEPIATTTLTSGSTLTFSSIPSTYTDLVLAINGTLNTSSAALAMTFNSDSATNYSYTRIEGNGTSASSTKQSTTSSISIGFLITTQSFTILNIQNYANTGTYKTVLGRYGSAADSTGLGVGLWRSTAAINRIDITVANSFGNPTYATLYGIAAA
jgi:hypothetical protein